MFVSWHEKYEALRAALEAEGFRTKPMDRSFLGRLAMRFGMAGQTLGRTILVDPAYVGTYGGYSILRHEAVHARDMKRFGWVPFNVSYVLLLPAVVSIRAFWEWRAYRESLLVEFEETGRVSDTTVEWVVSQFSKLGYGCMFPFPWLVRRWVRAEVERLEAGAR